MRFGKLIIQQVFWRGCYFLSFFIVNILISRFFKADGSGWIYYITNNLSLLLLFIGLSLESGATYYASHAGIKPSKIALICLLWSIVATGIGFLVLRFLVPGQINSNISATELIAGCCCYLPGILLTNYFSALFFAEKNFFLPNLVPFLLNIIWVILFLLFRDQTIIRSHFLFFYFSFFLIQGLLIAGCYLLKNLTGSVWELPTIAEFSKVYRYSLLAVTTNIIFFLVYRVDYWIVKQYCSPHDLGNYIQVSKLVQVFLILPGIIGSVIFPVIAGGKDKEIIRALQVLSKSMLFIFVLLSLLLAVTGQWLFVFVFGDSFDNMYLAFLLLIPGLLALSVQALIGSFLAGTNRVHINLKASILSLVIMVAGDVVLIPKYGIRAAAAMSSVAYIVNLVYILFFFCKIYGVNASRFFIPGTTDAEDLKQFYGDYVEGALRRPITKK